MHIIWLSQKESDRAKQLEIMISECKLGVPDARSFFEDVEERPEIEAASRLKAGGLLRTSTRPTLNLLLLLETCV